MRGTISIEDLEGADGVGGGLDEGAAGGANGEDVDAGLILKLQQVGGLAGLGPNNTGDTGSSQALDIKVSAL